MNECMELQRINHSNIINMRVFGTCSESLRRLIKCKQTVISISTFHSFLHLLIQPNFSVILSVKWSGLNFAMNKKT